MIGAIVAALFITAFVLFVWLVRIGTWREEDVFKK